jgi:predicted nucleic acid-binding protein
VKQLSAISLDRETLICDTSFVANVGRRRLNPERFGHWDQEVVDRIEAALLVVSIVTLAEFRAGYIGAGWGSRRVADAERLVAGFIPVLIDDPYVNEWARLSAGARRTGVALSDNDLWIAATATARERVLVTCDRDHVRIAPELGIEVLYLAPPV